MPVVFEMPHAQQYPTLEALNEAMRIDERRSDEAFERDFYGENYFHVVGLMERILVMFLVARPKVDVVESANKTHKQQEKFVESARFKDGVMTKLMKRIEQKRIDGAMEK